VSSTAWHARRELIVRDAMQMRVLVLWGTNGWRLPRLEWEHYPGVSEPEPIHVRRFAHDELGLDATILRACTACTMIASAPPAYCSSSNSMTQPGGHARERAG
jgi:hypothetical protein